MRINWRTFDSLPLAIRKEVYKRDIDEELKNFEEFEKALRGDDPEVEEEEETLEFSESQNGKITIIKNIEEGDDPEMGTLEELILEFLDEVDLPVEFEKAQKILPEKARKVLREAFAVLNRYKESMTPELLEAVKVLGKYVGFGYPYPEPAKYPYGAKKELEKKEEIYDWKSFFDFDEEDIEEEKEIEKSLDPNDKFPTLTKNLIAGQRKRDREREKQEIDLGRRFL